MLSVFGYDRDLRRQYNKGKKLIAESITSIQKESKKVPFTVEELLPAWNEYLECYLEDGTVAKVFDRKVAAKGMQSHRNDPTHSAMSILGQINFYDSANKYNSKKYDRIGNTLKGLMVEYNEATQTERFAV